MFPETSSEQLKFVQIMSCVQGVTNQYKFILQQYALFW